MEVTEIWESFNLELRNYVKRRVHDENLADDIVQDVFEKVIKNIQRLQEVENIQEYLYKITRNTVIDSFRARKLVFEEFEQYTVDSIDTTNQKDWKEDNSFESLNTIVSNRCIKPLIEKLPQKYKEAVIAAEINNMPQKELAEELNISYSGAKSRVQRGREKLKDLLQECCSFKYDMYGNLLQSGQKNCDC